MRRLEVLFFSTLLLAGCVAMQPAQAKSTPDLGDRMIIPGERVGPIRLGMYLDELLATMGRPEQVIREKRPKTIPPRRFDSDDYYYDSGGLVVFLLMKAAPKVTGIAVFSTRYQTDRGIKVGSSSFDVARAYPEPHSEYGAWMAYYMPTEVTWA